MLRQPLNLRRNADIYVKPADVGTDQTVTGREIDAVAKLAQAARDGNDAVAVHPFRMSVGHEDAPELLPSHEVISQIRRRRVLGTGERSVPRGATTEKSG